MIHHTCNTTKDKLPKDWITVNSKTHPDRIYYFNIRTNKSSWMQPTLDKVDKTSFADKNHKNDEREECLSASTSKHYTVEKETTFQGQSHNKIETPHMKNVREKMYQRLGAKNKSPFSIPKTSYVLSRNNRIISSSLKNSSLTKNDTSITSTNKNNTKRTFVPQMCVLREKIHLRNLSTSNSNKTNAQDKQENLNMNNRMSMKIHEKSGRPENQERQESINQYKSDIEQYRSHQKQNISRRKEQIPASRKNLARDRMQTLRKSLNFDKGKFKEIYHTVATEKAPQRLNKSLPSSQSNDSESTCVYRNVEVRLKRLHNKIFKDAIHAINMNNNKSQIQQDKTSVKDMQTKDKLIEQANQEILYEKMDWEPMNDEEITLEVEVVRAQLCKENCTDGTNCISENAVELQSNKIESQEKGPLYIVVDTNVFLTNLEIIEQARGATFKNYPRPFIVIPWTVICELDYFKENKSKCGLWTKARKAISFIHEQFSSKHPRVIGQTREQATKNKEDFALNCPDDEVLQCCLQIQQLGKSVVLLSYDKNLCIKAMIYNILALGRHDPLEKINSEYNMNNRTVHYLTDGPGENSLFNEELLLTDNVFEDTKAVMKDFLSTIIVKQMAEIYGEAEWEIYVVIKPPWTIVTALKCTIKHWIAAINESFQRRAENTLKNLLKDFEHAPAGGRKLQDVECVLEKCNDLVQMVNTDKYCELMTQTLNAITELKKRCLQYITDMDQKKLHEKIGTLENTQEQEVCAEKAFECFQHIYNYTRDMCGLACSIAGMACSFNFNPLNPPLSSMAVQHLRPEITRKVIDLTENLNKLLMQTENSIKYQILFKLQQNLNTFLPDTHKMTLDVTVLDIYYCVQLKKEILQNGLRQLQELNTHFCALATHT